jgi:hypothetical protein
VPEDFTATTNSYLEVFLTATDSRGVSTTVSRELRPHLVNLNFATQPAGLGLDLNGAPAPASLTSWEGWTLQLDAPSPAFDTGGVGETFVSWSDRGAQSHAITTPSTDTTYTATYTPNYIRPRGATTLRVPLVPAYRPCVAPNSTHGGELAGPSCAPPKPYSNAATLGTIDSNGQATRASGYVQLHSIQGDSSTEANEADVKVTASITDVRKKDDLTDYTGELWVKTGIRVTDRLNGSPALPGTVRDYSFNFRMPCTPTSGPEGSTCQLDTTVNALSPGDVVERQRTIWQLDRVGILDGGPDGDPSTPDNTLFLTQGLFVP